jgi:methyl-accepting chemotaxis protein
MSFKNKLRFILFILGIVPAVVISLASSRFSESSLLERSFETLETANTLKVNLIENYLQSLENSVQLQASSPAVLQHASAMINAYSNVTVPENPQLVDRAKTFYNREFLPAWQNNRPDIGTQNIDAFFGRFDAKALYFQERYIFSNANPVGKKDLLLSDGSNDDYDKAHAAIHGYMTNVLKSFRFYDLFIIDLQGNIVYSVFKEVDFGSSLTSGPFHESVLAKGFSRAVTLAEGEVYITDYESYVPSYDTPAGFITSPLFYQGQKIGVLAAQFPIETLNQQMSNRNGLGETGDSFLVGKDQLLRSDSIISPKTKSVKLSFANPEQHKVSTQSVQDALKGQKGTLIDTNMAGEDVLVSYAPISFANLGWVIVSEINSDEALAAINTLNMITIISIILLLIVCFVVIAYLLRLVMAPLGAEPSRLKSTVDAISDGHFDIEIPKARHGSVMDSMLTMRDKLVASAEQEKFIKLKNEEDAREKLRQAELDAKRAEELLQIKQALDVTSTSIMIADSNRTIVYLNHEMAQVLQRAESALQSKLPNFSAAKVIGLSMDTFHKNPHHQSSLLQHLTTSHVASITVADMHFRLTANPIFNEQQQRIGTVLEWLDRTKEVIAEKEISEVVAAAQEGRFDQRISEDNKTGFMALMASGLNQLTQTTSASLDDINRVLRAIAQGDLTQRVSADYKGSFESLKLGCNQTADYLSQMMTDIRTSVHLINAASTEISKGNTDLSSRTEEQASSLEETASSMEQLASTVRQNADNARQANMLAAKASDVALEGGSLTEQVVHTMASINESAQKIADIIGVIDGIAFQTNILALNAAVEAARAGEQGRGFAVVASEVRTLAQRSANAAKDIKSLISDSVIKIKNGNELVGKSGNTMREIVTSIKRVNDIMAEIAAASLEQSTGLDEVGKAVTQMDEMTQQNAALVEEAAAAAESLLSQSEQLASNVARFKLDDEPMSPVHRAVLAPPKQLKSNPVKPAAKALPKSAPKMLKPSKSDEDEWESF